CAAELAVSRSGRRQAGDGFYLDPGEFDRDRCVALGDEADAEPSLNPDIELDLVELELRGRRDDGGLRGKACQLADDLVPDTGEIIDAIDNGAAAGLWSHFETSLFSFAGGRCPERSRTHDRHLKPFRHESLPGGFVRRAYRQPV